MNFQVSIYEKKRLNTIKGRFFKMVLHGPNYILPGAIIGDGDRKRAPFQVLGLSPRYGTIILFLEQIAPYWISNRANTIARLPVTG